MKIIFLSFIYPPDIYGGAEITIRTLVQGMAAHGHDVRVLCLSSNGSSQESDGNVSVRRLGISNIYFPHFGKTQSKWKKPIFHLLDLYNPIALIRTYVELKRFRPDVCFFHNLPGWSASVWHAAHLARVPVIQVLHDPYNICPKASMFKNGHSCEVRCKSCTVLRIAHPSLSRTVAGVIGVSKYTLDLHRSFGLFERSIPKVIRNARKISNFAENIRRPVAPRAGLVVGFIGRIDISKGIEKFLNELGPLSNGSLRLVIAGEGEQHYFRQLRDRWASSHIVFTGRIEPKDFFGQVDIVVVPSLWNDTLPGVVFESFAYSKPVIGSNRGGIPEMIVPGVNGFVFDADEDNSLRDKVLMFQDNPTLLGKMSLSAQASALPFLDVSGFVQKYEAFAEEILRNELRRKQLRV